MKIVRVLWTRFLGLSKVPSHFLKILSPDIFYKSPVLIANFWRKATKKGAKRPFFH